MRRPIARPVDGVFFDFHLRDNVVVPKIDGGRAIEPRRLVFSMDMMGLGDGRRRGRWPMRPPKPSKRLDIRPSEVDFVVPHQAGTSVVRPGGDETRSVGCPRQGHQWAYA